MGCLAPALVGVTLFVIIHRVMQTDGTLSNILEFLSHHSRLFQAHGRDTSDKLGLGDAIQVPYFLASHPLQIVDFLHYEKAYDIMLFVICFCRCRAWFGP